MISIDLEFPDLYRILSEHREELDLFIAANLQTNRGMIFDSEGSYNGRPGWAPLKMREGQILSQRGTLRKSMAPYNATGRAGPDGVVRISRDSITIGTTLFYAAMMNWGTTGLPGGVLKPKKEGIVALKIPLEGGKFMFRRVVRIPARHFDDWTNEDQQEIEEALSAKIAQILDREVKKGGKNV